ncbi:MAG: cytochrome C oxidase subunit IV family protein [Myxococcota bacterium]
MAEHEQHTGHDEKYYVRIWGILLALLAVSIIGPILAPHVEDGFAGIGIPHVKGWMVTLITAFGIAIVKAYMVAANFMHLNIEKKYISYLLITMIMLMLLFFAGVSPDVMRHEGTNWTNVAAEEEIDRALKAQEAAAAEGHGGDHEAHGGEDDH